VFVPEARAQAEVGEEEDTRALRYVPSPSASPSRELTNDAFLQSQQSVVFTGPSPQTQPRMQGGMDSKPVMSSLARPKRKAYARVGAGGESSSDLSESSEEEKPKSRRSNSVRSNASVRSGGSRSSRR